MNLIKTRFLAGIALTGLLLLLARNTRGADDYTFARTLQEYVAALGGNVANDREDAEVTLSMLAASDFPTLLAESQKPGLRPGTAKRLSVILERERPRNFIRARLLA